MFSSFRINTISFPAAVTYASASGGTVTTPTINGLNYKLHTFTTSGSNTFTVTTGGTMDVLLVAAGGVGGHSTNTGIAGGKGGDVYYYQNISVTAGTYTLVVGASGNGYNSSNGFTQTLGTNSTGFGYTALVANALGNSNGSGYGGGGAGAGGAGAAGSSDQFSNVGYVGTGGPGVFVDITGTSVEYGAGGGGSMSNASANGAAGGRGATAGKFTLTSNATANTGSGSGGSSGSGTSGLTGNSASGIIIVRYRIA